MRRRISLLEAEMQVQMKCAGEDRGKKNKVTLMARQPRRMRSSTRTSCV